MRRRNGYLSAMAMILEETTAHCMSVLIGMLQNWHAGGQYSACFFLLATASCCVAGLVLLACTFLTGGGGGLSWQPA